MIDLYTFGTPNGRKVSVMLEEVGLAYKTHRVDIGEDEQFAPEFVALNLNSKIPVIVDNDCADGKPLALSESGAILVYLADKTNSPLLPKDFRARAEVLQWLMFQMAGFGPMCGQVHHFTQYAPEKVPYAINRYMKEVKRLYGVLDRRLGYVPYLAGAEYSIADVAIYPWVDRHEFHHIDLAEYPNVGRWLSEIAKRPAVQKGMNVPSA